MIGIDIFAMDSLNFLAIQLNFIMKTTHGLVSKQKNTELKIYPLLWLCPDYEDATNYGNKLFKTFTNSSKLGQFLPQTKTSEKFIFSNDSSFHKMKLKCVR